MSMPVLTQELLQENDERTLQVANKTCSNLPPLGRAPWLVFFAHGKQQTLNTFLSLPEERIYVVKEGLEEMSRASYYAHWGSWLFMTDLSHRSCFLLNLSSNKKIVLPPPPRGSRYISDVVITSSPTGIKGTRMILSYRADRNVFLFHRLFVEDKWEMVKCNVTGIISPVICNGIVYAIARPRDELAVIDLVPIPKVKILPVVNPRRLYFMSSAEQLLESCGELFRVCMFYKNFTKRLFTFEVYRLDTSNMEWVEVTNLGDRALFVGTSNHGCWDPHGSYSTPEVKHWGPGMSCSASRAGIAPNCIYFTEDPEHNTIFKFDLADKSVSTEMSWTSIPKPCAQVAWVNIFDP